MTIHLETSNPKKLSVSLEKRIGELLLCRHNDGRVFSAVLIGVSNNGNVLYFENSRGEIIVDRLDELAYIGPKEGRR